MEPSYFQVVNINKAHSQNFFYLLSWQKVIIYLWVFVFFNLMYLQMLKAEAD